MKTPRSGEDGNDGDGENAYSRAFSKIIKSSYSDSPGTAPGPVLAARKQLVAKKLAAQEDGVVATKKEKPQEQKRHLVPEPFVNAKEMALIKLATKGVVTLFNAVTKAQKIQADSDALKARDAKEVIKRSKQAFLSEINTAKSQAQEDQEQDDESSRWPVLQHDFVLGKSKLKNWDKDESGSSDDDNSDGDDASDDDDDDS